MPKIQGIVTSVESTGFFNTDTGYRGNNLHITPKVGDSVEFDEFEGKWSIVTPETKQTKKGKKAESANDEPKVDEEPQNYTFVG